MRGVVDAVEVTAVGEARMPRGAGGPCVVGVPRAGALVHVADEQYRDWLWASIPAEYERYRRMCAYRAFVRLWPDLSAWFAEPLRVRSGLPADRTPGSAALRVHQASSYLVYLSLVAGVGLDYDYLLGRKLARLFHPASGTAAMGVDLSLMGRHLDRLAQLGYSRATARHNLAWGLGRLMLHRGSPDVAAITVDDLTELAQAFRDFAARADFLQLRQALYVAPLGAGAVRQFERTHLARVYAVANLLFNTGQIGNAPIVGCRPMADWTQRLLPEPCPPAVREVVERYLRLRLEAKYDRPETVRLARQGLRRFVHWLGQRHPGVVTLAVVDRAIVEDYLQWIPTCLSRNTGMPLVVTTVKHEVNAIAAFFREPRPGAGTACPAVRC